MKQRMFNVFIRVLKNEYIAKLLAQIGYGILRCVYCIYKIFLRGQSSMKVEKAREILNNTSRKPDMFCSVSNKEKTKDLSIIVPAYNAEATISECIYSVIDQKNKYEYELIIINDGSKDNTQKVIESIKDVHIRLINQENKGFSGARNRGIDESVGRYIMFLDSDDYLVGNCIEKMMDTILSEGADIVQGSYYSFVGDETNKHEIKLASKVIESDPLNIVSNPGFPWAKIYNQKLFEQIRFPMDVWFEDTIVCMLLYRMCNKMVVMEELVYAYRINPEGITKKARQSKKCVDHYWVMEYVLEQSHKIGLADDDVQYKLLSGHMSTLLYRRISLMDAKVMESAFVLACDLLDKIRPDDYEQRGTCIEKDIEKAFRTRNFKLWKVASFVV